MALWDTGSGHVYLPNFGSTPNEIVYEGSYLYVGDAVQSLVDQGAFDWIQQQSPISGQWLQWMVGSAGNTMYYLEPGWLTRVWLYKAATWYYWPYGSGTNPPPDGGDGDGGNGGEGESGGSVLWIALGFIGAMAGLVLLGRRQK